MDQISDGPKITKRAVNFDLSRDTHFFLLTTRLESFIKTKKDNSSVWNDFGCESHWFYSLRWI